jgi:hypothetical protein
VEGRNLLEPLYDRGRWLGWLPYPRLHSGEDVVQLNAGVVLGPAAAASARAVARLVQHLAFAFAVCSESKAKSERAIGLLLDFDSSGRGPCHYARSHVEDLPYGYIGASLPGVGPGALTRRPATTYLSRRSYLCIGDQINVAARFFWAADGAAVER